MMRLVDFLSERIADDENNAHSVSDSTGYWYTDRLLAECEAKRWIMAEHSEVRVVNPRRSMFVGENALVSARAIQATISVCYGCGERSMWPCLTLKLLATVYADHPDYPAGGTVTDEPEITVQKIGGSFVVSAEALYGTAITPTPFGFGPAKVYTAEERAEWARKAEERKQRAAEYAAKIDAISDPFARAVLDLHARKTRYGNDDWQVCEGCDMDGYEAEEPGWPCRTVVLIGNHFGIEEPA